MSSLPFAASDALSLGVELELQVINRHDADLMPSAPDLLRLLQGRDLPGAVTPEVTSSMIELATGVCHSHADILGQLDAIRVALVDAAHRLDVGLAGGGTHPFQHWASQRIADKPRYQELSELYGYLSKQFTVFGQHVHLGCPDPDTALYTLHCLSRFIPHLIALSASSPFVQGEDTGYDSARLHAVSAFPLSGRAPALLRWVEFEAYFDRMRATGIVSSMKDFYWDIRPKPEYGTVEVRVMDTPLSIAKAADLAALVQALGRWIQLERPFQPCEDDYLVYGFNRFQACRFGFDAVYVDPSDLQHRSLREHLLRLLFELEPHARALGGDGALRALLLDVSKCGNDAQTLRARQQQHQCLAAVVRTQCDDWMNSAAGPRA